MDNKTEITKAKISFIEKRTIYTVNKNNNTKREWKVITIQPVTTHGYTPLFAHKNKS